MEKNGWAGVPAPQVGNPSSQFVSLYVCLFFTSNSFIGSPSPHFVPLFVCFFVVFCIHFFHWEWAGVPAQGGNPSISPLCSKQGLQLCEKQDPALFFLFTHLSSTLLYPISLSSGFTEIQTSIQRSSSGLLTST